MKYLLTLLFFSFTYLLPAQMLTGISTYWDDSFEEWIILTDQEDLEGELKPRWLNRNDWSEWDWELGDESVTIKKPLKNDPNQWEVRGFGGDIVSCRTMWKNDFSEWKITNNSTTLTFRSRYRNNPNEWLVREQHHGNFEIYTNLENDLRDWIIIDELDEAISPNMKIALVFLAIYNSLPRG